jgi:hypothetical protein
MRPITKLVLFGGPPLVVGVVFVVGKRRSTRVREPEEPEVAAPGEDVNVTVREQSLEGIDEAAQLHIEELDLEARAVRDLEEPQEIAAPPTEVTRAARGSGELYGVHTPSAVDHELPDGDASFDEGENWIEALEASAIENGPEPERELDIVDEDDLTSPPTDTRDIPVADRGSAGPRGL